MRLQEDEEHDPGKEPRITESGSREVAAPMAMEGSMHRDPEERRSTTRRVDRERASLARASAMRNEPLRLLPPGYHLDRSDPDILFLRRPDGRFVAAFSARGATREGIEEVAWKDHWDLEEEGRMVRPFGHPSRTRDAP